MKDLKIIKIGGNIINDEGKLASFLEKFSQLGGSKILVHGGGKLATQLAAQLGVESKMIDGRRITDAETLKIVTMVYGGYINKNIVAKLQALECNAIGFTGADGNIIPATKRQHPTIDYGFVGDIDTDKINASLLDNLLQNEVTPVFCALTHDSKGNMLNTNADTIASTLAVALSKYYKTSLIYCFEKNGVLENIEDDNSVIESINKNSYQALKAKGIIYEGMIPKLDNSFDAIDNGVHQVIIKHADNLHQQLGTVLKK